MQLVLRDQEQGPFLSKVLAYGREQQLLSAEDIAALKTKAVLMSLKFADKFYNKYKMHLLEQAAHDVVGVVSLGLAELSGQDLPTALTVLKSADGIVKPFQKGWSMLVTVSPKQQFNKSIFGDVDEQLLNKLSCQPDAEEWHGWQLYQNALKESERRKAVNVIKDYFFHQHSVIDGFEDLENMLAEVVIYSVIMGDGKVKRDLKQRIRNIEMQRSWFDTNYLQAQTETILSRLPVNTAAFLKADLRKDFTSRLLATLKFAEKYRERALSKTTPDKLNGYDRNQAMKNPMLGWPDHDAL